MTFLFFDSVWCGTGSLLQCPKILNAICQRRLSNTCWNCYLFVLFFGRIVQYQNWVTVFFSSISFCHLLYLKIKDNFVLVEFQKIWSTFKLTFYVSFLPFILCILAVHFFSSFSFSFYYPSKSFEKDTYLSRLTFTLNSIKTINILRCNSLNASFQNQEYFSFSKQWIYFKMLLQLNCKQWDSIDGISLSFVRLFIWFLRFYRRFGNKFNIFILPLWLFQLFTMCAVIWIARS